MALPSITATQPTTVQPAPAPVVYDKWYLWSVVIDASDPNNATAQVVLRKYRYLPDGSMEFSSVDPAVNFTFDQLLQHAAAAQLANPDPQDVAIAQAMGALLNAVVAVGTAKGLI